MRVAVYARVSTLRQAQTQNLEQQLQRLQSYIKENGWQLAESDIFRDDGYSGFQLKRPGLDKLRDKITASEFNLVLITAPDRLARNYVHQVLLLDELQRFGCKVEFLERPMAETPHDQLLLQIRGAVAEYERTLIAERMRRGRMAKLKAGLILPWTRPPYGYRLDCQHPRDPSGVRLDEVEAAIVYEIFQFYLKQGSTLYGLVRYLEANNMLSPSEEKIWSTATLKGILTNPTYMGLIYSGRMKYCPAKIRRSATHPIGTPHGSVCWAEPKEWVLVGKAPAIVSEEEFQMVGAKLAQNRSMAKRNNKSFNYLLRAMVSCGWCRKACSARCLKSGNSYYLCPARCLARHLRAVPDCPSRYIPSKELDELVWKDLYSILLESEQIKLALERAYSGNWLPQALQARRENLSKGLLSLNKQLERLTQAYLASVIPLTEYQKRRKDLEDKVSIFHKQLRELEQEANRQIELSAIGKSIEEFCQRVQRGLDSASFEQKRQLVELLVDRVIVKDDLVEICYVIPTSSKNEQIRFCHLRSDYLNDPSSWQ